MKRYLLLLLNLALVTSLSCESKIEVAPQDDIIRIEFDSDTSNMYADNQSIIQMKAVIPKNTSSKFRNVTFNITEGLGTFQTAGQTNNATVNAGDEGIARINLKVGGKPGIYYISAKVQDGETIYKSRDYPINLVGISTTSRLSIAQEGSDFIADGYSLVKLTILSKYNSEGVVKLTTNLGTFINSTEPNQQTLTFDSTGYTSTTLRISNEAKPHVITATINPTTSSTLIITPELSYPDTILYELSNNYVDTIGGSVRITTFFKKFNSNMKVSKGTQVYFRAYQTINSETKNVGRFTGVFDATSDSEGKVPAVSFFADTRDIVATEQITVEASSFKNKNDKTTVRFPLKIK